MTIQTRLSAHIVIGSILLATAACAPKAAEPVAAPVVVPTETEVNREVVTKFMDVLYKQRKVREAFETYVVPEYIQHNPLAPDGRDAAIAALEPFFASAPEATTEVKRIIVDGNLAAVHAHAKMNAKDRGFAVVDILRLENGKIVEHWDVLQPVPEKSANPHPMF